MSPRSRGRHSSRTAFIQSLSDKGTSLRAKPSSRRRRFLLAAITASAATSRQGHNTSKTRQPQNRTLPACVVEVLCEEGFSSRSASSTVAPPSACGRTPNWARASAEPHQRRSTLAAPDASSSSLRASGRSSRRAAAPRAAAPASDTRLRCSKASGAGASAAARAARPPRERAQRRHWSHTLLLAAVPTPRTSAAAPLRTTPPTAGRSRRPEQRLLAVVWTLKTGAPAPARTAPPAARPNKLRLAAPGAARRRAGCSHCTCGAC
mmetsp:Transcript_19419/g.58514  ORF Transcript_19419/g.58514 Transcript_19419/m.58514 type:complete len:264 (+) Transcript_19419:703-1494(+)